MYARSAFQYFNEQAAEDAFAIAWNFVSASYDVDDEFAVQAFIAAEIMRLLERGERNRIRLANLTIAAYEKSVRLERELTEIAIQ
jgi:hypothetical protein